MNRPTGREAWRVAALTMMSPQQLRGALQGNNAAQWVEAAAACGIGEADLRLGRMLLEGNGAVRNLPMAFSCFEKAAKSGSPDAHNMLGRCFENGWGTEKNWTVAVHHYRVAAEAGLDWAQYNLGHMLLSGSRTARDGTQAFLYYSRAAAQGHVRAMNLVGRCLEEGWGTPRDAAAARAWYRRSARGGYFRGAYNYAGMIRAEGCVIGARFWFARALANAPEPSRSHMIAALSSSMAVRAP